MKVLLRTKPGETAVVERPRPQPGPDEALVRVSACGICGSDLARLRSEDEKWNRVVLGHECCGLIEEVGSEVASLRPGQRVALLPLVPDFTCRHCREGNYSLCEAYRFFGSRQDGGLAEYLVAPERNLLPLPEEVDDEAGAMLEPLSVAAQACLLAEKIPGHTVLVMGAGTIGLLAVQMAWALEAAQVIACDLIPEKLEVAAGFGAKTVLSGDGSVAKQVAKLTEGEGADVCLECTGDPVAQADALDALAREGRMVWVGTGPGDLVLSAEQREQVCRKQITLRGQWMSYAAPWPGRPWTLPLALLGQGRLEPQRLITHRFSLDDAPEAVAFMLTPGSDYLKVMIQVSS